MRVRDNDLSCQPHAIKDVTLASLPGPNAGDLAAIELHRVVYDRQVRREPVIPQLSVAATSLLETSCTSIAHHVTDLYI
jgi:hypothetical protein